MKIDKVYENIVKLKKKFIKGRAVPLSLSKKIDHFIHVYSNKDMPIGSSVKLVSHKHKFLYISISKTGSSSIKKILKEKCFAEKNIFRNILKKHHEYFKFAFVRNPWDRILSCYLNKIKSDRNFNNDIFTNGVAIDFQDFPQIRAGMSFKSFVKEISKINDGNAESHFRSQYYSICNIKKEIIVDFLGRFENIKYDFDQIMEKLSIKNIKLPHENRTDRKLHYSEYYDEETKKLVAKRYKDDIRIFNYKFEDMKNFNQICSNKLLASHKNKFIFIHSEKTGGTTIREMIKPYLSYKRMRDNDFLIDDNDIKKYNLKEKSHSFHLSLSDQKKMINKKLWNSYCKFTFVRNPWDLIVSSYSHRMKALEDIKDTKPTIYKNEYNKLKNMQFKEYCINFDKDLSRHFLDKNGKVGVDYIGKFENFKKDTKYIFKKIGIKKIKFLHENRSKHKHYSKYYDKETKKLVAERYKNYIKRFNYKFETK